jgi:hypothetical protein
LLKRREGELVKQRHWNYYCCVCFNKKEGFVFMNHPRKKAIRLKAFVFACLIVFLSWAGTAMSLAAPAQRLGGHVPAHAARATALSRVSASQPMRLSFDLPLRNREALTNLIELLYDESSPQQGRFLTPEEFAAAFGPTQEDYDAVVAYALSNGFTVTGTHSNRIMVDVEAPVATVEKAFGVRMNYYQHPNEDRQYFAPDADPALDLATPMLHVSGLDNYTMAHPRLRTVESVKQTLAVAQSGSGTSGTFMGYDFRKAYLPNVSLTGDGQTVGLFQLDGYYASDIARYVTNAGLPGVTLRNVLVGGFNGNPTPYGGDLEVSLDIEMVMSMAPGLSRIIVYEASPTSTLSGINALLNRMATDNAAKQLSSSWGFDINAATEQIYLQFAAQGQSFFQASGDYGAYSDAAMQPTDSPYVTSVGGTVLSTSSAGAWVSETAWSGSGGGISAAHSIPSWQAGVATSANHASTTMRNMPDVAMVADNILVYSDNGSSDVVSGTSVAAPLWAGVAALINQRAATTGKAALGFLNPMLYKVGRSGKTGLFHDIVTGNNYTTDSPSLYPAVAGYDLCTGWGTPYGTNLFDALLATPSEPLVIASSQGFIASGPVGGPFNVTSQAFTLNNIGTAALTWSLSGLPSWLVASTTGGQISSGGSATATISLSQSGATLSLGAYSADVTFLNANTSVSQTRQFRALVGNPGFENGDLSNWTFQGQPQVNWALSIDNSTFNSGSNTITGVEDSAFTHSGLYGAFLGQNTTLGYLSQSLTTSASAKYLLSFWFFNPLAGNPNEFKVMWNGTTLYDGVNLGVINWTNFHYVVSGTGASSPLKFGFRNDANAFGLDDISFQIIPSPTLSAVGGANGVLTLSWSTLNGVSYQPQYRSDLSSGTWLNLGSSFAGNGATVSVTDTPGQSQRFYRVIVP